MSLYGKNDAWPQEPYADRSAILREAPPHVGYLLAPSAASVAATMVAKVIPCGEYIYAMGEAQQPSNGYAGGQCFISVFDWSGNRKSNTHLHRKSGTTRIGGFDAQPLPNGNIIVGSSIVGHSSGAHVIISEIDPHGNIIRGCQIGFSAVSHIFTGLCRTGDPWLFGYSAYNVFGLFDAREFTLSQVYHITGNAQWRAAYDPMTDAVWVNTAALSATGSGRVALPLKQCIEGPISQFSGNYPVIASNNGCQLPLARWGDYLFMYSRSSSNYDIHMVLGAYTAAPWQGTRFTFTPPAAISNVRTVGMAATSKAVYVAYNSLVVGGSFYVVEIVPNSLTFDTSKGVRCRAIKFPFSSSISNDFSIEAYGELLSITACLSSTAGRGVSALFSFDDMYDKFCDSGSATQNRGGYALSKNEVGYSADITGTITLEEWTLTYVASVGAIITSGYLSVTRTKTTSGAYVRPVWPSADYFARPANEDVTKVDVRCTDFIRNYSL